MTNPERQESVSLPEVIDDAESLRKLAVWYQDNLNTGPYTLEEKEAKSEEIIRQLDTLAARLYMNSEVVCDGTMYIPVVDDNSGLATGFNVVKGAGTALSLGFQSRQESLGMPSDDDQDDVRFEIGHLLVYGQGVEKNDFSVVRSTHFLFAPVSEATVTSVEQIEADNFARAIEGLPEDDEVAQELEEIIYNCEADIPVDLQALGKLLNGVLKDGVSNKEADAYLDYLNALLPYGSKPVTLLSEIVYEPVAQNDRIEVAPAKGDIYGNWLGFCVRECIDVDIETEEAVEREYPELCVALETMGNEGPRVVLIPAKHIELHLFEEENVA